LRLKFHKHFHNKSFHKHYYYKTLTYTQNLNKARGCLPGETRKTASFVTATQAFGGLHSACEPFHPARRRRGGLAPEKSLPTSRGEVSLRRNLFPRTLGRFRSGEISSRERWGGFAPEKSLPTSRGEVSLRRNLFPRTLGRFRSEEISFHERFFSNCSVRVGMSHTSEGPKYCMGPG
jgi:hypothetical protein